jgi:hypothetical protein
MNIPWSCLVLLQGNFEDGDENHKIFLRLADTGQRVKVHEVGHHGDRNSVLFMFSQRERLFSEAEPSWFWCYPQTFNRKNGVCVAVYLHELPKDPSPIGLLKFCGLLKKEDAKLAIWVGRARSKKGAALDLEDPLQLTANIEHKKVVEGTARISPDGSWVIESCMEMSTPKPKKRGKPAQADRAIAAH